MRLYNVPIHRAVGTASGFGLVIAIPSVIGFLLTGWTLDGRAMPPMLIRALEENHVGFGR